MLSNSGTDKLAVNSIQLFIWKKLDFFDEFRSVQKIETFDNSFFNVVFNLFPKKKLCKRKLLSLILNNISHWFWLKISYENHFLFHIHLDKVSEEYKQLILLWHIIIQVTRRKRRWPFTERMWSCIYFLYWLSSFISIYGQTISFTFSFWGNSIRSIESLQKYLLDWSTISCLFRRSKINLLISSIRTTSSTCT